MGGFVRRAVAVGSGVLAGVSLGFEGDAATLGEAEAVVMGCVVLGVPATTMPTFTSVSATTAASMSFTA